MANLGAMDAHLVRAAGLEPCFQQRRCAADRFDEAQVCDRALPHVLFVVGDAAAAIATIADEHRVDRHLVFLGTPGDQRKVAALDVVPLEQALELGLHRLCSRDEQ
jgi:hypothetical protein